MAHAGGRPSKYNPEYAQQAYKLCLLGATDKELADFFGTTEQSVNAWKKKYPEFLESLKAGKQQADANVAESLYKRACGYEHEEDKIFQYEGEAVIVPTIKHYPPDTAAAFIWLKNRAGWKDKTEVESTDINLNIDIEKLGDDELIQRIETITNRINAVRTGIGAKGD